MRKNFNNLRQAAKVLQSAWRERKKQESSVSSASSSSTKSMTVHNNESLELSKVSNKLNNTSSSFANAHGSIKNEYSNNNMSHSVNTNNEYEEADKHHAAATLQAATRRMIARKSFESVRKQTMASLVIQRHFTKWWEQSKHNNSSE